MQGVDASVEERRPSPSQSASRPENLVPADPRQCPLVSVERISRDCLPPPASGSPPRSRPGDRPDSFTDRVEFTR